ncbi:MAG: hypothetical protein U9Q62_05600 [Campylobacterota bacterium]|nr:hypothetical protein [Campylobacterota bacterium]
MIRLSVLIGYPALNSFGRQFKASGYTMMGTQGTITDPGNLNFLSLPGCG